MNRVLHIDMTQVICSLATGSTVFAMIQEFFSLPGFFITLVIESSCVESSYQKKQNSVVIFQNNIIIFQIKVTVIP